MTMDMNQFFIAGINYKKTDASIRGKFAINPEQYQSLLNKASKKGIKELFVLSTCNRTEIYGIAPSASVLVSLLCSETSGDAETFQQLCYIRQGINAVEHLFVVASGLDSQILGDYEIVGQIKHASKFAKQKGFIGTFLERLLNFVLQSSKIIKNQTGLSSGTVSVSFAAIQFLKEQVEDIHNKKIVVLGTGKIGRNTCKNLVDYLNAAHITLINRTEDKARELADELNLRVAPFEHAIAETETADIVIVATNSEEPIIKKQDLLFSNKKILIDLSIPNNVEHAAGELEHITLVNVDELSRMNDATLQNRMAEVPKANEIIAKYMDEFTEWYSMRKNVPVLKAVKQKLMDMHQCNLYLNVIPDASNVSVSDTQTIQKVINSMAVKMRQQHRPGCNYIEAINDFIASRTN